MEKEKAPKERRFAPERLAANVRVKVAEMNVALERAQKEGIKVDLKLVELRDGMVSVELGNINLEKTL